MPFSLSGWLLKQIWHLRYFLLEPFAVTLETNASLKGSVDLVWMPGGVAQTLPAGPQAWAEPCQQVEPSHRALESPFCSALQGAAELKREGAGVPHLGSGAMIEF